MTKTARETLTAFTGLLLAALVHARPALADGLSFEGDRPQAPHFILELDSSQQQVIAAAWLQGSKYPEIRLTAAQQAFIETKLGVTVPWLFAPDRATVTSDCTCGTYNLGVVLGDGRLAVLDRGLGDHLSPGDLKAIEAALVSGAPAARPPSFSSSYAWKWFSSKEPMRPPLEMLTNLLPAGRFDRVLRLPPDWQHVTARLPAFPKLGDESDQDYLDVFADSERIRGQASAEPRLLWGKGAARLNGADGSVAWLLPAVIPPGIGPPTRAWALFIYRGKRLVAVAAAGENSRNGGYAEVAPPPP